MYVHVSTNGLDGLTSTFPLSWPLIIRIYFIGNGMCLYPPSQTATTDKVEL